MEGEGGRAGAAGGGGREGWMEGEGVEGRGGERKKERKGERKGRETERQAVNEQPRNTTIKGKTVGGDGGREEQRLIPQNRQGRNKVS